MTTFYGLYFKQWAHIFYRLHFNLWAPEGSFHVLHMHAALQLTHTNNTHLWDIPQNLRLFFIQHKFHINCFLFIQNNLLPPSRFDPPIANSQLPRESSRANDPSHHGWIFFIKEIPELITIDGLRIKTSHSQVSKLCSYKKHLRIFQNFFFIIWPFSPTEIILPKPSHGGFGYFSHWYLCRNRYNKCRVWNMLWKVPWKKIYK